MRWCAERYNRDLANMTLWAYLRHNSQVLVSRSGLVVGQEVYFSHVHCGRGFSCPSDCLVYIFKRHLMFPSPTNYTSSIWNSKYFRFSWVILGYKQTFTLLKLKYGVALINGKFIKRWERNRSKCFFTYILLDLFRSHPSILTLITLF